MKATDWIPATSETLAAANVLAADQVISADHVALRLGETCAVTLIGAAAKLCFLAADEPGKLIFALLTAMRTGHRVGTGLGAFIEKIAFFHLDLQGIRREGGRQEPN